VRQNVSGLLHLLLHTIIARNLKKVNLRKVNLRKVNLRSQREIIMELKKVRKVLRNIQKRNTQRNTGTNLISIKDSSIKLKN